jgi:hypothetical protein
MNIIEAVKMGTWIRRTSKKSMSFRFGINEEVIEFTREDLLADDWEAEPQGVTITREKFNAAWDRATPFDHLIDEQKRDLVAKELGL